MANNFVAFFGLYVKNHGFTFVHLLYSILNLAALQYYTFSASSYFFCHPVASAVRCYSHGSHESDEEFDARWVTYFNKPDIDAWELRKGKTNEDCCRR